MLTPSISIVLNNIGDSPFWLSEGRSAFRSFEHPILRQPFFKPSAITFAETLSHFPLVLSEKPHPESDGVHSSNKTRRERCAGDDNPRGKPANVNRLPDTANNQKQRDGQRKR